MAATALKVDQGLLLVSLRSCVCFAALAVAGAVMAGPNLASGLVLGWLMATALVSAQSNPAWWMWNMPETSAGTTASAALLLIVAVAVVGIWSSRGGARRLHHPG